MKRNILLLAIVALIFNACKDDNDEVLLKSARIIRSFKVPNMVASEVINYNTDSGSVRVFVDAGTNVSAVKPTIVISDKATITPGLDETIDFSDDKAVTYKVKAQSGLEMPWKVTIMDYIAPAMKTFVIDDFENLIITQAPNIIKVYYHAGTDVSAVTPVITVTKGASISPASGQAVDFETDPEQTFTVTHPTGTKKTYIVRFIAR